MAREIAGCIVHKLCKLSAEKDVVYMVNILVCFLSRVSILTRDIDSKSVRLSVTFRYQNDENGLTYRHSFFFTIR